MTIFEPVPFVIVREGATLEPPETLDDRGVTLWREVLASRRITSPAERVILEHACQCHSRAESLRQQIVAHGELIITEQGAVKANPLLMVEAMPRVVQPVARQARRTRGQGAHGQAAGPEGELLMTKQHQLTDEMVAKFKEGCALLRAITPEEYRLMRGEKWERFKMIDKFLTWKLVDPGGPSVFDDLSTMPSYLRPDMGRFVDWPVAVAWQKALIEASGETPRSFRESE
jgi:hypothetical protein